ncbi:MAG: TldD/PmbA family protein [Rubrimonas sp.]|uniref:TldD/PmbA family protein n=1 Tax=Rubrimonas sp. TaxID=2036015 RepID=UPI002FDD038C
MHFPLDLADRLLDAARAAGADAADALVMRSADLGVAVRGGALEEAERAESVDFGLRAFVGRRQACVSASDPRPETLRALAERAVAMAREAPEDPYCGLLEPGELGAPDMAGFAAAEAAPPDPARLQTLALEAEAAALAHPGVSQVDSASASWRRAEIALAATNGFRGAYARDGASLAVSAIAGEGLGMQSDYDYAARRRLDDLPPPAEIGREAAARAVARLGARKPPTGAVPVVFDRRVAPSLIGHVLAAINGASVARGSSWLAKRMGERILPGWAELLEDPLAPDGPSSRPFDGEGMASRAAAILRGGVLERWLLDAASARQLGLASTGNARRGVSAPPSPGATNVRLGPGAASRDALIADIERGLLVTSLMGSSVNPTTGAYSRGASGFWIENGRIAHPVEEATIAGALPEFLPRMDAADDPDPFVSVSVPSLRVEGLVVAGA